MLKPIQHHALPPRPQHIRHPMHQGPNYPGHPPPHMTMNMGPPPQPQQQPHHMPNAPPPRGPPPEQFGLPQMRDHNRLGHHQHHQQQQHQHQRLNSQMHQNQMQHHKGRLPHGGGGGPQAVLKHTGIQKNRPPQSMRNNIQHAQQAHKSVQQQQPQLPPPQTLSMGTGCGMPQMQILKPPQQPQLPPQQQQKKISAIQQDPMAVLSRPPPVNHQPQCLPQYQQQTPQQNMNVHLRPPARQHQKLPEEQQQHPQQSHQQQRPPQRLPNTRSILQNPNRATQISKILKNHVSMNTPLPTVSEVESAVISNTQKATSKPDSEKLSASAEDFTPQSSQNTSTEDKSDSQNSELLNDILSVVMKGDSCFSNSKEKTPMCLVNELARYNKIQHQYRLTSENGPAHCKRFTVTLKLGEEEYSAEGFKIKKAQHTAAAEAIKKTKYKHPLPKPVRRPEESLRTTITPTVELNALAMKLGQQTYYVFDPRSQLEPGNISHDGQYSQSPSQFNNPRMPRYMSFPAARGLPPKFPVPGRIPTVNGMASLSPHLTNGIPPELCKITLIVGKQKFVGSGRTLQSAKHDAASRALQVLKTQAANKFKEALSQTTEDGDWKSPISLVHEIAIKRDLSVVFKVLREEGPAHMKNFVTICEVGDIVTEGDGNGKKISKKRAAEKMLEELKKLPPLSPSKSPPVKRIKVKNFKQKTSPVPATKKKSGSSIREKTESECAEDENPISRLIQIQQSRNEKEPAYELISRSGESKKREFLMEVNIPGKVARGAGPSKKLAKRSAAQNLLISMGIEIEDTGNEENDSQIANQNFESKVMRKVKFNESGSTDQAQNSDSADTSSDDRSTGREIVPGVLLLRQHSKDSDKAENRENGVEPLPVGETPSSTKLAQKKTSIASSDSGSSVRPKDQLLYLAQILGFQANFSDYPKGNHSEFLSIVTLSTSPPQICHGVGLNTEESQDQAASAALQILSKLGLDNIKPIADG